MTTIDPIFQPLAEALAAEFSLESELGRGGMGVVFRARDLVLDREVALKVLPPQLGADAETRARFLREARTAGQLSHPHIVHIHRADERAGFAYFVMGLVDGETLGQRVRDRGPLSPADAVRHVREVAWALAYAHARGVIHRDVKPENILIERGSNRALVTDFGIARTERAPSLTSEGHVVGTAHFMSPEQIQGGAVDGRADLYALGVVGYYLLSGRLPFDGESAGAVLVANATRQPPPLANVAPHVPAALTAVIDRCLSKSPDERFATGEDLSEALRRALEGAVASGAPTVSGGHATISEEQAALVWKRAAQLQAEAAARLERQLRETATRALVPSEPEPASSGPAPTNTYRLRDVEAAAVEAGISQRFVALALSEMPSDADAVPALDGGSLRDRVGAVVIGRPQRSLSVARIIRAPARDVLQAIGQCFQSHPYRMTLDDQIGPHPLDGGILVFKLPDMDVNGYVKLVWLRYGVGARQVRVTLRVPEHDRNSTEVTAVADLRPGLDYNVWGYAGINAGVATASAATGLAIGLKAMALTGILLAAPIAVTGFAGGALAVAASRAFYRAELRWATKEMEDMLQTIDGTLRSRSLFSGSPATSPPAVRGAHDNMWTPPSP
jgi:hypothetical protein